MRKPLLETVEFNGVVYKRHSRATTPSGKYFYAGQGRRRKWLHREVWKFYYGPIPVGYHVHHRFDNDHGTIYPRRLKLLSSSNHTRHHMAGVPKTAEHRAKLSATKTGKKTGPLSDAHRAAIARGHKGKSLTADQYAHFLDPTHEAARKAAISEGQRKRWALRKTAKLLAAPRSVPRG